MEERIEIEKQIASAEAEVNDRIQKLKVKKTLDFMKKYQKKQEFDTSELSNKLQEMNSLLEMLEVME